jgi:hypothetical protein
VTCQAPPQCGSIVPPDLYEIRNAAGLEEVRIWAEENANGRLFVVYVQIPPAPDGPGVVRITGKDPTWPD